MPPFTLSFPRRGLYVITRESHGDADACCAAVSQAIRGGAAVVQYRAKHRADPVLAGQLLAVCRAATIPFIINDDVTLAESIGADGVHLGRDDVSLREARSRLGDAAILGISCYDSLERAIAGEAEGANYVAFGRFFPSATKPNAPLARLATLRLAREQLNLPIVAIGGIDTTNAGILLNAGADLLAVIEGVFGQNKPDVAARQLAGLFDAIPFTVPIITQ